jgi:Insertion element 4 transposase N-terminal
MRVSACGKTAPARLVVYFVLALWLFRGRNCGYGQVMVKLADGLYHQRRAADLLEGQLDPDGWVDAGGGRRWKPPNISNLSRGRGKLGPEPLRNIFLQVAGATGTDDTPGMFCCGLRIVSNSALEYARGGEIPCSGISCGHGNGRGPPRVKRLHYTRAAGVHSAPGAPGAPASDGRQPRYGMRLTALRMSSLWSANSALTIQLAAARPSPPCSPPAGSGSAPGSSSERSPSTKPEANPTAPAKKPRSAPAS